MKEYPILFKGEMVRAILESRKTMTRRIPDCRNAKWQVGDRLWVRETFRYYNRIEECICYEDCSCPATGTVIYRASNDTNCDEKWKSPLFMRRSESRILLEITAIREERLQDITEADAQAEGVERPILYNPSKELGCDVHPMTGEYRDGFAVLWDSINSKRGYSWSGNPIVKVIEFRRVK